MFLVFHEIFRLAVLINLVLIKQAQICAEGCEEDNFTHFFRI